MLSQTQLNAKQIEQAANAISKDTVLEMENKLKERAAKIEEMTQKIKEVEDKSTHTEEELKTKL